MTAAVVAVLLFLSLAGESLVRRVVLPPPSREERLYGLSLVWTTAKQYYGMWDLVAELDWDQAYQEAIPKVLKCNSLYEYYKELEAFTALLQDGHSGITTVTSESFVQAMRGEDITAGAFSTLNWERYLCPIHLGYLSGKYVVTAADEAVSADLPLGTEILTLNGLAVPEYLEREYGRYIGCHTENTRQELLANSLLRSTSAARLTVTGRTPEGAGVEASLTYQRPKSNSLCVQLQGPLSEELKSGQADHGTFTSYTLPGGVYAAVISSLGNAALREDFAAWIEQTRGDASAYILDVRGNSGGNGLNGLSALLHFIAPEDIGGYSSWMQARDTRQILMGSYAGNGLSEAGAGTPYEQYCLDGQAMYEGRYHIPPEEGVPMPSDSFAGITDIPAEICGQPLVILTDWRCGSAGEDFAAYAKGAPNVTIIGTNTRGTTGSVLMVDLPGQMSLHISVYKDVLPDGTPVCNHGVQPDIWSEQTVEDALAGRDTVLLDALAYLETALSGKST